MMRIALLSCTYPPYDTEGISRQRYTLAAELGHIGHEVHVITLGRFSRLRKENDVYVHQMEINHPLTFSSRYPGLDEILSQSQRLYEGVYSSLDEIGYDVVDVPLWGAQGFVTQWYYDRGPVILWLQTTTAQILEIYQRQPGEDEKARMALERLCLERAHGILADSNNILEAVEQDYGIKLKAPSRVVHLGLPPLATRPNRPSRIQVEALVVGRLEKRKGTPILFEILPALMQRHPQLVVRFVGRDNSISDGWQALHRATYPQFFKQRYSHLVDRVFFEGYVSEKRLQQCYEQADLLLAPSLYESFGLIYLEAMRCGLPVVTFATGAAAEIFSSGKSDGAILVPEKDAKAFAEAISLLVENPQLRCEIGETGLERFHSAFTAEKMANSTLEFYREVISHYAKAKSSALSGGKIYQVMEALDYGDAVSTIAIRNATFLEELGQPKEILTYHASESVKKYTAPRRVILSEPDCGLIFHYWGYNHSTWILFAVKGRKAIYYHNITPPEYFSPDSEVYRLTAQGYVQLARILDSFDLLIGDSQYNIQSLAPYLSTPKPALPIYPVVEPDVLLSSPYDEPLFKRLRSASQVNIVFVGRIARNKRQDRIMRLFDYYYCRVNQHAHLWLVGSDRTDPAYRAELEYLRLSLPSCDHIHLTGKISDAEVYACYRAADLFLSASEHEGFGMPLIEAMVFDVPVIAYAAAAVPETMGKAGILIKEWDIPRLAELIQLVIEDVGLRNQMLEGQKTNLARFSKEEARQRMQAVVRFLQSGYISPLMQIQKPS